MRLITIIAATLLVAVSTLNAAEKTKKDKKSSEKIHLTGDVFDSFTRGKVKAFITLMNTDSTVVDTMTCHTYETGTWSFYTFRVPREEKKYIIRATADGYRDTCVNYELTNLSRNRYKEVPTILMKKKQDDVYKDVDLDGVVVKGTRIQVAYKGDTIVYDASAFKLPEGSMLDGLIRQLPGAELKDNGDIYINGVKIDYLTLNGKDFFKGDNKVMLDNLPYFTVKNLKVFYKNTKKSEMLGRQVEEQDYVMDVTLKREYSRGYIANAEVGAGTENRWMSKAFGLLYTDHTRVSMYGSANNVNEDRTPGSDGEWDPKKIPNGVQATRQLGMNLNTEDKEKRIDENLSVRLTWSDSDDETRQFRETFSDNGSIFSNSWAMNRNKQFNVNTWNSLYITKAHLSIFSYLYYTNNKNRSASADSTYAATLTNRSENIGRSLRKYLNFSQSVNWNQPLKSGDFIDLDLGVGYNSTSPSDYFYRERTYYAATGATDVRNRYNDSHNSSHNYTVRPGYFLMLPKEFMAAASYEYNQRYTSTHSDLFNLERLPGNEEEELGWLPTLREDMMEAYDTDNSRQYNLTERTHTGQLYLQKYTKTMGFFVRMPYSFVSERMNYRGHSLDTVARRSYRKFSPAISFKTRGKTQRPVLLEYRTRITTPDFASLMPMTDTSNPLSTRVSNPDIKSSVLHHLKTRFTFRNDSIGRNLYIGFELKATANAQGTRTTYNPQTGAYTRMRDNVDGNWTTFVNSGWQQPLDAKKRFRIDLYGKAEYQRSVDFATVTTQAAGDDGGMLMESPLSKVDNVNLIGHIKLTYKLGDLSAGIIGKITSRHTRGKLDIVRSIDANDFQYGWNATYTIPVLNLTVATDMTMFSRRGYESSVMNTDELIWNAQLTRSFCKGALTAKIQAFDLLQNLSSTRYSVNAQGRTETWNNCIPRYVMCSLAYKFSKKPKKD